MNKDAQKRNTDVKYIVSHWIYLADVISSDAWNKSQLCKWTHYNSCFTHTRYEFLIKLSISIVLLLVLLHSNIISQRNPMEKDFSFSVSLHFDWKLNEVARNKAKESDDWLYWALELWLVHENWPFVLKSSERFALPFLSIKQFAINENVRKSRSRP